MHAKRVTVLPIHAFSYLPKVCPPCASSAASARSVYSLTNFSNSTGAACLFHSQAPYDYPCSHHTSGYYKQNPSRFPTQTQNVYGAPGEASDPEDLYIQGFLEVFDAFCNEGKVEAVGDVLRLLDKKGVKIDSRRCARFWNLLDEKEALEAAQRHALFIASNASLEGFDSFCKEGKVKEAVEVLPLLDNKHISIDLPRYVRLIKLCGDKEALEEAKIVHEHVIQAVSSIDVNTYNQILEMYVSCGSMDNASAVFEDMAQHNLTTWDIMIRSLAENELGEEAIELFHRFKQAGLKPDERMFVSFFHACAAAGDVYEGMLYFESMTNDFEIAPTLEHYKGVVEMLGRAGHLDEALEFIESMPLEPSVDIWDALMNLCRIHGSVDMGKRCADIVEQLDSSHLTEQSRSGLVQAKPSDIAKEEERKKLTKKDHRLTGHELNTFHMGDTSHPETPRIYAQLRGLRELMKEAGYIPNTRFAHHDIDLESKEDFLLAHSAVLAISYALMNTRPRTPVRVIQSMRTTVDCHNMIKIMSKIVGREFILRDHKRFHHIKNGVCSCRDLW